MKSADEARAFAAARHEAGHCIVGSVLGHRIKAVTVRARRSPSGSVIDGVADTAYPAAWAATSPGKAILLCAISLAGPIAEGSYEFAEHDADNLAKVLALHDVGARSEILGRGRALATQILSEREGEVASLAGMLVDKLRQMSAFADGALGTFEATLSGTDVGALTGILQRLPEYRQPRRPESDAQERQLWPSF